MLEQVAVCAARLEIAVCLCGKLAAGKSYSNIRAGGLNAPDNISEEFRGEMGVFAGLEYDGLVSGIGGFKGGRNNFIWL